jgi:hypothetical protein
MLYNPAISDDDEPRDLTIEICVSPTEKATTKAFCKALGVGVSTWYRNLANAEMQRHGKPPAHPKESRGCRGPGRTASRAGGAKGARNMRRSW